MYGHNLKLFKSEFIPVLLLAKILSSQKQSQEWRFSLKRYPNIIKYKKFGSCNGASFTNSTDLHHCSYQGLTLRAYRHVLGDLKSVPGDLKIHALLFMALIFTVRCYACTVPAMGLCPSVCLCVSQISVLLKRLNTGSQKQNHTIAQGL